MRTRQVFPWTVTYFVLLHSVNNEIVSAMAKEHTCTTSIGGSSDLFSLLALVSLILLQQKRLM